MGTPLGDLARIYVDGNNLLHRRLGGGGRAGGGAAGGPPSGVAVRLLLAGMRAALPETLDVVLILDGQPDPGAPSRERIRHGLEVRHAGRSDADSVLVDMVSARPFAERARTLVVTDDRALIERVRHAGGRTERLDWLEGHLWAAESGSASALGGGPSSGGGGRSSTQRGGPRAASGRSSIARGSPPAARPVGGSSISQGKAPPARPTGAASHPQGEQAAKEAGDTDQARAPWRPGRNATRKHGNPKRGRPQS